MFQRIVVPLDGSALAEQALPVAAHLARASGGTVVLLRVFSISSGAAWQVMEGSPWVQEELDAERTTVKGYLEKIAATEVLQDVGTEIVVAEGIPAEEILKVSDVQQASLIVMCSHGYTGFRRWMMGSVALKVARHSHIPVLVLREGAGIPSQLHPDGTYPVRVMVPLDGSELAEAALAPAATLSIALSAPLPGALHLVRVLPFPDISDVSSADRLAQLMRKTIAETPVYLNKVAERMQSEKDAAQRLQITTEAVTDTDVAARLIEIAEATSAEKATETEACDIIALTTHGQGGPEHWLLGSMVDRVMSATRLPLLIVRPVKKVAHIEAREETQPSWVGLL